MRNLFKTLTVQSLKENHKILRIVCTASSAAISLYVLLFGISLLSFSPKLKKSIYID